MASVVAIDSPPRTSIGNPPRTSIGNPPPSSVRTSSVGRPLSTADTKGSSIELSVLKSIAEVPREQWEAISDLELNKQFLEISAEQ